MVEKTNMRMGELQGKIYSAIRSVSGYSDDDACKMKGENNALLDIGPNKQKAGNNNRGMRVQAANTGYGAREGVEMAPHPGCGLWGRRVKRRCGSVVERVVRGPNQPKQQPSMETASHKSLLPAVHTSSPLSLLLPPPPSFAAFVHCPVNVPFLLFFLLCSSFAPPRSSALFCHRHHPATGTLLHSDLSQRFSFFRSWTPLFSEPCSFYSVAILRSS